MSRRIFLLVLGVNLFFLGAMSKAFGVPKLINYQGRLDVGGSPVSDGAYSLHFKIYTQSTGGTAIWQETQSVPVRNGIFSVMLGSSTPLNLDFKDDYWLGVAVGNDSEMTPRQRIVSVGYSFRADYAGTATYAETAGAAHGTATYALTAGTATMALDSKKLEGKVATELEVGTATYASTATYALTAGGGHYIGELYGGGIVFWVDHTGQHGLIASLVDISTGTVWSNISDPIGPTAQSTWNGQANSNAIINQSGHLNSAAKLCDDYTNSDYSTGIYSDWYLPAIDELSLMYHARYILNKNIEGVEGANILGYDAYWSSTERMEYSAGVAGTFALYFSFKKGDAYDGHKSDILTLCRVRAVRAF